MSAENDEVFANFMTEMSEKLSDLETDLAELAKAYSVDVITRLFRSIHTIKGGSGFFGLEKITALTHVLEDLLMQIREGDVVFVPEMMPSLFSACDTLKDMHEAADFGSSLDIDGLCRELKSAASKPVAAAPAAAAPAANVAAPIAKPAAEEPVVRARRSPSPPVASAAIPEPVTPTASAAPVAAELAVRAAVAALQP